MSVRIVRRLRRVWQQMVEAGRAQERLTNRQLSPDKEYETNRYALNRTRLSSLPPCGCTLRPDSS